MAQRFTPRSVLSMISSSESQPQSTQVGRQKGISRPARNRPRHSGKVAHLHLAEESASSVATPRHPSLEVQQAEAALRARLSLPSVESFREPHLEVRSPRSTVTEWPTRPSFSQLRDPHHFSNSPAIRSSLKGETHRPQSLPASNSDPNTAKPIHPRRVVKRRRQRPSPFVYATRWLILIVGFAVISGTLLSILNAFSVAGGQAAQLEASTETTPPPIPSPWSSTTPLTQELTALQPEIESLITPHPEIKPGIFLVDLDTGNYLDLNGNQDYAAASTIKVPILVAFFQAVDQGSIRLDETLTMTEDVVAEEAGDLRYQPIGTQLSALEVASKMITISDNTATNMLIKRLGGPEVLNQQFRQWGLQKTAIHNLLPDLGGTNTTSAFDMVSVIAKVNQEGLVSLKSRDRLFGIMQQTRSQTLLPQGLDNGAVIAHKTGNIDKILADVGMVDMPNGKRYVIAVIMEHPPEQEHIARTLIQDVSRKVYQHLNTVP